MCETFLKNKEKKFTYLQVKADFIGCQNLRKKIQGLKENNYGRILRILKLSIHFQNKIEIFFRMQLFKIFNFYEVLKYCLRLYFREIKKKSKKNEAKMLKKQWA